MDSKRYPQLAHPPIAEAILDIRVVTEAGLGEMEQFAQKVALDFPSSSLVQSVEAVLSVAPGSEGVTGGHPKPLGQVCWNPERTRAVQARIDGFTVNHVKHYESWAALRSQALRLWAEYSAIAKPKSITRLALRYINRLKFPVPMDFELYFKTRAELGAGLPQGVRSLFMRIELPFGANQVAIITQSIVPREAASVECEFILDIDAISERQGLTPDGIWTEFDLLHDIKNRCFFESLHSKSLEQYE